MLGRCPRPTDDSSNFIVTCVTSTARRRTEVAQPPHSEEQIMFRRTCMMLIPFLLFAVGASAVDFGAHIGYFDNDVKKAYVGADLMFPIGPVSIAPNIDYTKIGSAGLWWANGDVVFRFGQGRGPSFWVGAGPTYYYVTNADQAGAAGGYSSGRFFLA